MRGLIRNELTFYCEGQLIQVVQQAQLLQVNAGTFELFCVERIGPVDGRQQTLKTFSLMRFQRPSIEALRRRNRTVLFHEAWPPSGATRKCDAISGGIGTDFMGSLGRLATQTMVIIPVAIEIPSRTIEHL